MSATTSSKVATTAAPNAPYGGNGVDLAPEDPVPGPPPAPDGARADASPHGAASEVGCGQPDAVASQKAPPYPGCRRPVGAPRLAAIPQEASAPESSAHFADEPHNIRLNTLNGTLQTVSLNLYNPFLGIDLIRMGGAGWEVGLLSALPPLGQTLSTLAGARWLADRHDPKRAGAAMFAIARLLLLGLAAIHLGVGSGGAPSHWRPLAMISLVALISLPAAVGNLSWQTVLTGLLQPTSRASALAVRGVFASLAGVVVPLAAGWWARTNTGTSAYTWFYVLAAIVGLGEAAAFLGMRDGQRLRTRDPRPGASRPPRDGQRLRTRDPRPGASRPPRDGQRLRTRDPRPGASRPPRDGQRLRNRPAEAPARAPAPDAPRSDHPSRVPQREPTLLAARRLWNERPYRAYTLCCLPFYLGWLMAWPLFTSYQVRVAHATTLWMAVFAAVNSLAAAGGNALWRRIGDRLGTGLTLPLACILLSLVPLTYVAAPSLLAIVANNVLGGVFGAGVNLYLLVRLMEVAPREDRVVAMGVANTVIGAGGVAGPMLGMALVRVLPMPEIFWVPTALRLGGGLALLGAGMAAGRTVERGAVA